MSQNSEQVVPYLFDLLLRIGVNIVGESKLDQLSRHNDKIEGIMGFVVCARILDDQISIIVSHAGGVVGWVILEDEEVIEKSLPQGRQRQNLGQRAVVKRFCLEGKALNISEQIDEGLRFIDLDPHRDGVDEESDDLLHTIHLCGTTGDDSAEHDVMCVVVATKNHCPRSLQERAEGYLRPVCDLQQVGTCLTSEPEG